MTKFLSIPHFNCMKLFCYSKQGNESSVPILGPFAAGKDTESTPAPTKISEEETAFETPGGSLYSPSLEATLNITCTPAPRARSRISMRESSSPLEKMNQFLESKESVQYGTQLVYHGRRPAIEPEDAMCARLVKQ